MPFDDVQIIRWPAESDKIHAAHRLGMPCLFVVEGNLPAPVIANIREDWIRVPALKEDFSARIAMLRARAHSYLRPQLDLDGMLSFGDRTVALSEVEKKFIRPLVQRFGDLVPRKEIVSALTEFREDMSQNAFDVQALRVRRRLNYIGLQLQTVRGRGYILTIVASENTD